MRMLISGALFLVLVLIAAPTSLAQSGDQSQPAVAQKAIVNLNSATLDQLETLPGVGPKVAERIVEFRQKNGGFKKIEDLMNVKGIGEKSFLKLKPLVTVTPPSKANGGQ